MYAQETEKTLSTEHLLNIQKKIIKLFLYYINFTDWTVFIPEHQVILFASMHKFQTMNNYKPSSS